MEHRELAESFSKKPYFEKNDVSVSLEEGNRNMGPLYPFVISGGSNTERYYFTHINDITDFKFNIRPKYFGDESNYTVSFPRRIQEILKTNAGAKIFCVFDWDTIFGNSVRMMKHSEFEKQFQAQIADGAVTLCPSMPSIEFWFLLHFENYSGVLLKSYGEVSNRLAPYMKGYFPDSSKKLSKLLKGEKYLEDAGWVRDLCADDKLQSAIERAKSQIEKADNHISAISYTYVYKIFNSISLEL